MDGGMKPDSTCPPQTHEVDYRNVLSVIVEGVVITCDDLIIYANPAFAALFEKTLPEIVGKPLTEMTSSSEERSRLTRFLDDLSSAPGKNRKTEFRPEAAPQKILEMNAGMIPYQGGDAILAVVTDITERRLKRLEIDRLHSRLRSIIDSMRHVVISFSYNEEADGIKPRDAAFYDRYLVEINPAAEALYGVPKADFLNKRRSVFDFVHDQDKERVLTHYNNLFEEGIGELTYRVLGPNREIRWVLDYGRVEYLEGGKVRRVNHILEDITKEKTALDELRASEEKYRLIFENSKDMIYILRPDGSFVDINPAGLELLGLESREEAGSRNMKEFHVDLNLREALVQEIIEKGFATRDRIAIKNTGGERIEVDLNVIGRRDENGNIISYQGIVHNITEALRQKELEAIGQLAGCFADDLASPLTVAIMGIDTAKELLSDIRKELDRVPSAASGESLADSFEEASYFLKEAQNASGEIRSRLEEIRDRYWSLRKVSDGAGGLIYERESKRR